MTIDQFLTDLKAKVPVSDHPALESRAQALRNDPDVDEQDAIEILRQEFDR